MNAHVKNGTDEIGLSRVGSAPEGFSSVWSGMATIRTLSCIKLNSSSINKLIFVYLGEKGSG